MDTIAALFPNLHLGFSVALSLENLAYCFIGVFVGTMIGVLPGIGPLAAIAMLLPLTFKLDPVAALIMLSGIYYGTKYGGSTTAIMLKLPGESASVVTCLDGYEMAKQGRAGPALGMSAIASFIAGSIGTVLIGMFGPPLAEVALRFGAPESFSLMLFSLIGAAVLVQGSMMSALGMIVLGLLFGIVGTDVNSGMSRFTFGVTGLTDGISFVVIAMGLFGFAEIVANLEQSTLNRDLLFQKVKNLWPTWKDFKQSWNPMMRGTAIGAFFGILPGAGPTIASFSAYTVEKKVSKNKAQFGKGAIEGVAGPEAANNAAVGGAMVPTLALGIPGSTTTAIILAGLIVQGIRPGPHLFTEQPMLLYAVFSSMLLANLLYLVLGLGFAKVFARISLIPAPLLWPAVFVLSVIGAYAPNQAMAEVWVAIAFGFVGFFMKRYGFSPAPLVIGLVLGRMVEETLKQSLLIFDLSWGGFLGRPIALTLFGLTALFLLGPFLLQRLRGRGQLRYRITSSTRRFAARPCSVRLSAIGRSGP